MITNQATVYSERSPNLLTDGDGNPATGPEPTVVVVGDAQHLTIVKEVSVVDGGPAIPGAMLEYVVTVQNVGTVPALYVTLRDDLDEVNPGYLAYVDQSATLNGLPAGVDVTGTVITADYFTEYGALLPGSPRYCASVRSSTRPSSKVRPSSTPAVCTGMIQQQQADATVMIDVGAMPDAGMLSGYVWHDADHDNVPGGLETRWQAGPWSCCSTINLSAR